MRERVRHGACGMARAAQDFDLGGGFHYSGSYPMVFQHSGAQVFDLGGGFHYSGSYPMVFQHSGAQDVDLGGGFHYSGSYPMVCFNTVRGVSYAFAPPDTRHAIV